ncbi:phosphoribosylformylglycinamidine synthase subunit PurQ [Lactobacillus sp. S2-2]|uniref:phosphoribosylformylglycinamidine synthase subunit PurQ n=1 Tax=Lactobacillus sp. S2-2 TaxID=2692917 RepID=UPI001EFFD32F|nr:phosphoribosylformylglycinamidine synthase subunit PurQ [Lactobacillus sp. S2-2]MCF6515046.1 phosphoribosylformylglycinamidine synthase subunit PurQ [Lactobacillus sp. S2-2]
MNFGIISFPGSNCDWDLYYAIKDELNESCKMISSDETNLDEFDVILIPGGFSYGDYLRSGAIGSLASAMQAVKKIAKEGKIIIGICNGFQILTESNLLPGSLMVNEQPEFISKWQNLKVENNQTIFSNKFKKNQIVKMPIAHGEGNYYCDEETLKELESNHQIVFRYEDNPNGSVNDIAGITNKEGNILGMMPHPERAVETILGGIDGLTLFQSLKNTNSEVIK